MSATIYYDKDANLSDIKSKRIAVLGYGSQGRAQAKNLADSGCNVVVGLQEGSKTFDVCKADGLEAATMDKACQDADIICFLLPDPFQPDVYNKYVKGNLKPGQTIMVAHGFNIIYAQMDVPDFVDVIMIAPKTPGNMLRELYQQGHGAPCLVAWDQDASGEAKKTTLAYAAALGCIRAGALKTTLVEETETDLFGEQAILCGGISALMKTAFETLTEAGYAEEMAYFECFNEMKLIVDLIYRGGIAEMRKFVSHTAKYGDVTRGPRVIDEHVKDSMRQILKEIQNGEFAREWVLENQANRPVYNALLKKDETHPAEETGRRLRSMMNWLPESK